MEIFFDICCEGYIFQQDGTLCHKSKKTAIFLNNLQIKLLEIWPPLSPDLSPIENVWSKQKNTVSKQIIYTKEDLWEATNAEFNGISNNDIKKLFESMPKRIGAVIAAQGGYTK